MGRARRVVGRAPFGGGRFVADNSAWARAAHPAVRDEWRAALLGGQILTTPVVMLEVLFSARDGPGFDEVESALRALDVLPLTPETGELATRAQRELARVHPLYHRSAKIPDLLVAAAAQLAGVGVLHHDEDFDRIASVLEVESRWIAPRGAL